MPELAAGVILEVEPPELPTIVVQPPPSGVQVVDPLEGSPFGVVVDPPELPTIVIQPPPSGLQIVVPVEGPPGPGGASALDIFEYTMPIPAYVAVVDHTLGRDPVAYQVLDESGVPCEEYGLTITQPAAQVMLGFDVSIQATIRLL